MRKKLLRAMALTNGLHMAKTASPVGVLESFNIADPLSAAASTVHAPDAEPPGRMSAARCRELLREVPINQLSDVARFSVEADLLPPSRFARIWAAVRGERGHG
jgi:hypothetical protein